jgi:integrase
MWRFACRKKYLDTWPDVPAEKTPQLIPLAWSEVELAALYAAAAKQIDSVGNVPASLWWTALLLVVWDTGERIGALLSTPRGGVDRKCEWLAVGHEYRKGQDKDRVYRLGPKTSEKVRELLARHSEKLLFPWPYTKTYIWNRLEKILKNAGLPTDKRCKFHRMRRSVASHYEAAGGDATALLGHANRRTTIKHYLDPRIVPAHKPACEVLFKLG